jgi:hypothetical protein
LLINFQFWKAVHDLHGFEADGDDALEQLRVAGIVHGFGGPEVRVVGDSAVFVGGDGLADPCQLIPLIFC